MTDAIGKALFPLVKRRLLGLLFSEPSKRYYGREVARLVDVSYGTVIRELKTLVDADILTSERDGPHSYYRANPNCAVFDELVGLVTKTFGLKDVLADALNSLGDKIQLAAVFGSIAKGEATGGSDVDLLVVGNIRLRDLVGALANAESALTRPVNPVLYSPTEFTEKFHHDNHFVRSLTQTELLFIVGNRDVLESLVKEEVAQKRANKPQ